MDIYHEDDTHDARLFNREVASMLLRYVRAYKGRFAAALVLVAVITASTLTVPMLTRYLIDRVIVSQGVISHAKATNQGDKRDIVFQRAIARGVALNDSLYFLPQSVLSNFSKEQVRTLTARGFFSKEKFTLVRRPKLTDQVSVKIDRLRASGRAMLFSPNMLCFASDASHDFTVNELLLLRAADLRTLGIIVGIILGIFTIQFIASYLQIMVLMRLSQNAMRDLRKDLFAHILSLELSFFDKNPIGKLVNRVSNDIEALSELFSSVLIPFFQDLLILAGVAIIMFIADAGLGAIVAITFPALIALTVMFRNQARGAYRIIRSQIAIMNAFLNEHISGIRIVHIFAQQEKQLGKFSEINKNVYRANRRQIYVYGIFRPLIDFFRWFAVAGVLLAGATLISQDRISYGIVVMFLSYVGIFFEPIGDLAEKFDILQSATAAGEKILGVFNAHAVRELPQHAMVSEGNASTLNSNLPARFQGDIRFDNVWFGYAPDQWVLKGLSFSVPPQTSVAIVGPTGSGKTTIAHLLSRLYPVHKGALYIDSVNIADIAYERVRGNIATVMQDVFLFSRTVAQNITLNRPLSVEAFDRACVLSHCDSFIKSLPKGRDEPVMERGVTFSTGQRQLLAIARALYFDPSILILDEATSNIDTETELLIQDAIARLIKGRTSVIIAHRLSTVRNANLILVIDKGVIVEQGDHRSLIRARGMYYDLYKLQFEGV